jgi:hypothetical protein
VAEEVWEPVSFDAEAGVRHIVTNETVRGGKPLKQSLTQPVAPLSSGALRKFRARRSS